jgi:DNA-binding Lrp family transcriptional regulator
MRDRAVPDELDLALVATLQAAPRADWQLIGHVLGVAGSTAARRWARLTDTGLAWLACHPMRVPGHVPVVALIEIDCAPARLHQVGATLAEDPNVISLAAPSSRCGLHMTAAFTSLPSLARYTGFRLANLDGVTGIRADVATVHTDASRWSVDRLSDRQRAALGARPPAAVSGTARPGGDDGPQEADLALMTELGQDCRRPAVELADRTGLSPTTVHRRLARLESSRSLVYRCELASPLSGWPVSVNWWGTVPPDQAPRVTAALCQMREVRACLSLSGASRLNIVLRLRSVEDIARFETRLARELPALVITGQSVNLWAIKLGGHVLDFEGRRVRQVPVGPWPEAEAARAEAAAVSRLRQAPAFPGSLAFGP